MSDLVFSAGLFSSIGDWFYGLWINLWLLIDNVVYVFINWAYRIFILVAKVDIFGGGTQIEAITRRLYVIVGIAMLFIFAYNLILLIVNPEGKQLGDMSKVIKNAIISIILVTFLPLIFSYMTTIQNHVLESNVIGQIILGTSGTNGGLNKSAGVGTSLDIFSAFYHPEGQSYISCEQDTSAHELCDTYVTAFKDAKNNENISDFIWNADLKDGAKSGTMEYNWIISTAAGVFALWLFFSFALDIGVRIGKLAFYELIAPIPVMMRIMPGDKMFDKWFIGIKSTYISLFIRLAIIYFAMYAITLVPDVLSNMWADGSADNVVLVALANVVVILGILKFAQEAPKLLSDIFSSGGGDKISLGIASKVKDNKLAMGAMGMTAGGALGVASNVRRMFSTSTGEDGKKHVNFNPSNPFRGAGSGAVEGAKGGYNAKDFKGLGNAIDDANYKTREVNANYTARRAKGKTAIEEKASFINDIPVVKGVAQNVVGGVINVKDSVVEGIDKADKWLSGGSVSDKRKKAASKAENSVSAAMKAFSNQNIEALKKFEADARKGYVSGKDVTIPGKDTYRQGDRKDFNKDLKEYINAQKKEAYMSEFKDANNKEKLKLYQKSMVDALKEAMPTLGENFSEKFCEEYAKKFGNPTNPLNDMNSILSDISKDLQKRPDAEFSEKLNFIEKQMKTEGERISLQQKQVQESKK